MNRRLLLALVTIVSCFGLSSGALAGGITPIGDLPSTPTGPIVEVTRFTRQGDNVLRRDILIDTSIAGDPQAVADQLTQNEAPAPVTCATTPTQSEVVAQYCLNSWSWPESSMPVHVKYNPLGPDGTTVPSALGPIENAIQQWSSVTSNFKYVYDGATSRRPTTCESESNADGVNTIAWVDGIGGTYGILAQTCTVTNPAGALVEFDLEINTNVPWSIDNPTPPGKYDLYSNMLHELGHGAGIAHSQYASAVMWSSLNTATEKRTLTADDIAALQAKYGGALQSGQYRVNVPGLIHD